MALLLGPVVSPETGGEPEAPFGLQAGMALEQVEQQLGSVSAVGPFAYLGAAPEGSYEEVASLALIVTPDEGLCRIQATSEVIPTDAAGAEIRRSFGLLLERLWAEHGEPKVLDTLIPESLLGAKDQWMAALLAGDRVVLSLWNRERGSRLAEGLESVVLAARGLKEEQAYLSVEYVFYNWPGCEERLESVPRDTMSKETVSGDSGS